VIDFRYHLVSIIAVFLALAIGIVIGANELQPTTEQFLRKAASAVTQQNKNLSQQNKNLQQQVTADQAFAQAGAMRLIGHLLEGESVVLVEAPDASSDAISGLTTVLHQSGARITGQVLLQPQFFENGDANETRLTQLAQSLAPQAGVTLSPGQAGDAISGQALAAQVIAAAITTSDGAGLSGTDSRAVLGGFGQNGYLQISGPAGGSVQSLSPATMAVVVEPNAPPSDNDSSPANLALIALAEQLTRASHGAVLAGSQPGSGPGSAIDQLAGAGKVSTVDNTDQPVGQIVTVQALKELLSGRPPASYGVGPGTAPSPAPTPSDSPATTATQHAGKN
jgi:hypothetical protein